MSAALAFLAVVIGGFLLMHVVMSLVFRPRCMCLFEPWPAASGFAIDEDGSQWILYPPCRVHGRQQRTRVGGNEETASGQTLAV